MNNFIYDGNIIEIMSPYEVNAGDGVMVGCLFGIATSWTRKGELVSIRTNGVFDLARASHQNWNVGDPILWDPENRRFDCLEGVGLKVAIAVASTHNTEHKWVRGKLVGHTFG